VGTVVLSRIESEVTGSQSRQEETAPPADA
jgi:hypothetical protein